MNTAKINDSECRVCGCCIRSCPVGALKLGRKQVTVEENCIACGLCAKACPFDAIKLPEEN